MTPKPSKSKQIQLHTSEEMDALQRATSDGKHGLHYKDDPQSGSYTYDNPALRHRVRLILDTQEQIKGAGVEALQQMAGEQDADSALALLYIASLLLGAPNSSGEVSRVRWVELDDVVSKIGWDPRSSGERVEMRRRVLTFIEFVGRAVVSGRRGVKYFDRALGKEIDTELSTVLWTITGRQDAEQQGLYPEYDAPVGIQVTMTPEWVRILSSPFTAQYLPLGEVLGAIPGNKPSGAWARVIGLSLANFWRRNPKETLAGTMHPERRELLERFTPKTGPVTEVLRGGNTGRANAGRAIDYWTGALAILVKNGFLAPEGEATISSKDMRARYPHRDWSNEWLNEAVVLVPGASMREALEKIASGQPLELPEPQKRGRGRPRTHSSE